MASNLLSRLLPAADENSAYEPLTQHPPRAHRPEGDDNASLTLDEENLEARFQDTDLEHLLAEAADSQITTRSPTLPPNNTTHTNRSMAPRPATTHNRPRWMQPAPSRQPAARMDEDDDVPESLLLDSDRPSAAQPREHPRQTHVRPDRLPSPVPGPSTHANRTQWNTTRAQQRLYGDSRPVPSRRHFGAQLGTNGVVFTDPKEEAMWRWANVHNLDRFLTEVYTYYQGHGMQSILLNQYLNLLRTACVVTTCTILLFGINYKKIHESNSIRDIFVKDAIRNIHGFWLCGLWVFIVVWVYKLVQVTLSIRPLWLMRAFYQHLLDIPESDIQTATWQLVVHRLMALRDANLTTAENISAADRRELGANSKQRMDAHDIANRVMRRDNYLIALFNKDIPNLTVPLPFFGDIQFFSRTMELLLETCVMQFVFTADGHVRREFLTSKERRNLIDCLNQRFKKAAILSVLIAPVSVIYFVVSYFFHYFSEFRKDPSQLGSRMFTPMAEWKFREFNELRHLFEQRRNLAYPYADRYLNQFPKNKSDQLCEFVAFVVSIGIAVLVLGSLLYPETITRLEIMPGKPVFFWIGVLSAIYAAARNQITNPADIIMEPEVALKEVIAITHYCPASWRDRLHTDEVRREFSQVYQMKIAIFLEELLSMVLTPLVLWYSLPQCSERIVDFFREFTIHVDGLGHVCSYAVFDFQKTDNIAQDTHAQQHENYRKQWFRSNDGKLDASINGFLQAYSRNPGNRGPTASNFNLPPAFNPLAGSSTGVDHGPAGVRNPASRRGGQRAALRSTAAAAAPGSPMGSVLLDPHHQPSVISTRHSPHAAARSRYNPNRNPSRHLDELDEEVEAGTVGARRVLSPGQVLEDDSNLGESWLHNASSGGGDEDDLDAVGGVKGAGVLGLLQQFQNAHAQGRGPGV
ncbi:Autophagy-related protein 9 [Diplodia seriata]|uniref:Autophagy-related protein 9 n=1 Tax=Diplodia seriata TaxID=420778 RepID=A0A1S8B1H5_9PEZI|nr:Autophagy-related protein 9 [Diplodia seriata]